MMQEQTDQSIFKNDELTNFLKNINKRVTTKIKMIMEARNFSLEKLSQKTSIPITTLNKILDRNVYSIRSGRKAFRVYDYLDILKVLNVPHSLVMNMLGIPEYVNSTPKDIGRFLDLFIILSLKSKKSLATSLKVTTSAINGVAGFSTYSSAVYLIIKINKQLDPLLDKTQPLYQVQKELFNLNMTKSQMTKKYKFSSSLLYYLASNKLEKISLKSYLKVMGSLKFNYEEALISLGMHSSYDAFAKKPYGEYINTVMEEKSITTKQLANSLGLTFGGVRYIIKNSGLTIENAIKINHILEMKK
ncbi:hypothetical protein DY052_06260 [Apilactobacillus timberlakei]|uniref:hypothetical protein n=1 Tax=Apilactobacillus timberlakei TaxID=2008380 RepID=UPI0011261EDA|nr:hypothetical protein [Apilactobacillus timberlakei]TPR15027.1 hypothetical protein DY052_06260 [Apilactobacillus timberlakei]